jgi:putative hydrolases of HD superfamily
MDQVGNDTTDALIDLGQMALQFGRIDRITYHDDGVTPESDTDHTVMLGLIACAFAAKHLPDLDRGLIAQYALVHDLVEVYAGDTPTLDIDAAGLAAKAAREHAAQQQIDRRFAATLPWLTDHIAGYEDRVVPEARYVKAMDKLLPAITHILSGHKTLDQAGLTLDDLARRCDDQLIAMLDYAADFPALFDLRAQLIDMLLGRTTLADTAA